VSLEERFSMVIKSLRAPAIHFTSLRAPLLDMFEARTILEARDRREPLATVSLDLGMSMTEAVVGQRSVHVAGIEVGIEDVSRVAESTTIHAVSERGVEPLAAFSSFTNMFCRLRSVAPRRPPTIEIGGLHMHRIEGCDPLEDTRAKVSALGRRLRGLVLDTCMGLGYTAIESLRRGAYAVLTIELDPAVVSLAMLNPWTRPLATAVSSRRAVVALGDASRVVKSLPSEVFDYVIHDPPRFELAGELYSEEFYRELFRVSRPGARVFHYTGEPGKHGGPSIVKGVKRRLEAAGFTHVRWVESARGFVATRPVP